MPEYLAQKGECWTWSQRLIPGPGSIPTGGNILLLEFLFSCSKVSDVNIHIIANFIFFELIVSDQPISAFSYKGYKLDLLSKPKIY